MTTVVYRALNASNHLRDIGLKRARLKLVRMGENSAHSGTQAPATTVRAANLTKTHRSGGGHEVTVFSALNFQIEPGERVAIVGASGSGKSSLLHLLGGLDRPTNGTVFYGDQDLFNRNDTALAAFRSRHVAFVWQMNSLLPEFSAVENVMLPQMVRGLSKREARKRAEELLSYLGLKERLEHRPAELSGGEAQRVAIARAVANAPRVLLADEPTGNLDPHTADHVFAAMVQLVRASGLAAIIATHNMDLAGRMDRRVTIREGLVVEVT